MRPLFLLALVCTSVGVVAQSDLSTCSATRPCYQGCCSADGNCGFTPQHCGTGCQSNCNAKAECGQYAAPGQSDCPLNVCCSQFGYCGTTPEFCGSGCQANSLGGGCGGVTRPTCTASSTGAISLERRIGYYELFNIDERLCDKWFPEDVEAAPLTHINLAFVEFDNNYNLIDNQGELISRAVFLKARYAGLRVNIAIGGWAFNDPPTQFLFSNMASTRPNRDKFVGSVITFLRKYNLDGIDIDWEYPAANDRGGIQDDIFNYVNLVSELREAFDRVNPGWEITITIPTSYWYLRGFDLGRLQTHVSWFNLMSYDLHGMWDQHNKFTGPYLEGHTNITEIDNGLDLLWRNGIKPENVVMGVAFYGRSFTMASQDCTKPGCEFSTSGRPGSCTHTGGILSYNEVASRNTSLSVKTFYDSASSVKYNVYDGDQWISYDDQQSFADKTAFLNSRCLGGVMIWALDQDTQDHQALSGLFGDYSSMQLEGGSLNPAAAAALADAFGAYTGQNCFVTPTCTNGKSDQMQNEQVCPSGYTSVDTAHNPAQKAWKPLHGTCDEGWYRHICCPTKAMPKNCKWNGAPQRSEFGCSGRCGSNQFLLNTDTYVDPLGHGNCFTGTRDLCCDSAEVLTECFWTACQGPLLPQTPAQCWGDQYVYMTDRYDQDNGDWCSSAYVSPLDGHVGSPLHDRFKRAFCCPKGKEFQNCNWSNNPKSTGSPITVDPLCQPEPCEKGQTQVTEALEPPPSHLQETSSCVGFTFPPGTDLNFPYCCDPPSKYSNRWPVDPKDLFQVYYDSKDSAVLWNYEDNYRNNNKDSVQSPVGSEDGSDAYGFVMLDGEAGSLDNAFPTTNTIIRRDRGRPIMRRSIVTSDSSIIDSTFDHAEETIYIYCNFDEFSPECQHIWIDGAEDTIIRLPNHVGEGPFARVVSLDLAEPAYQLPRHHVEHRLEKRISTPIYKLKFDYDFHLIKRGNAPVNMRVDFTNLLGYWDELTNSPANKKRDEAYNDHWTNDQWRDRVRSAKMKHDKLRKRQVPSDVGTTATQMFKRDASVGKRWWGIFTAWLDRLNTVEQKNVGYLSMAYQKTILLFKATWGCPGNAFSAEMTMYLDANVEMEATYAYYFSGTIIPPKITGTYAYFGLEPSAYLGLRVEGNARLQSPSNRKKLLDTISYPGMSIKGIAAVGPTLDLYGEIVGVITLKGTMKAGATVSFGKAEVYWPQDDAANEKYQTLLNIDSTPAHDQENVLAPSFDVSVQVDASIDVKVTPEANMGIRIGGPISSGTLVDAQLVGFVNTSLKFAASVTGNAGTSGTGFSYTYGVYLLYNIGYGAYAQILGFGHWAVTNRYAYDKTQVFPIYGPKTGSFSAKRSIDSDLAAETIEGAPTFRAPRRGLVSDWEGAVIDTVERPSHSRQNQSFAIGSDFMVAKRADVSSPDGSGSPDFSSRLECPPGDSAQITLPDFRYNGFIFGTSQAENQAGLTVPGIYDGIRTFFSRNSLANSDIVLTWDPFEASVDKRRKSACGNVKDSRTGKSVSYCREQNDNLVQATGDTDLAISCDEFPFAGTEEGGEYYRLKPTNKDHVESTCVPAWQQSLQGSCNKLLSQLQTNVAYYERDRRSPKDTATSWVKWSTSPQSQTWTTDGETLSNNPLVTQRFVDYSMYMPQIYNPPSSTSAFMFRRNFTFGLARPSLTNDGAAWTIAGKPGASSWSMNSSPASGQDVTKIVCAVNIFGQDQIYQAPVNGLCANGKRVRGRGFDNAISASQCIISFTGANAKPKRSLGTFNGWNIEDITMLDDDEESVEFLPEEVDLGPEILVTDRVSRKSYGKHHQHSHAKGHKHTHQKGHSHAKDKQNNDLEDSTDNGTKISKWEGAKGALLNSVDEHNLQPKAN